MSGCERDANRFFPDNSAIPVARYLTENLMNRSLSLALFTLSCAVALYACSGNEKESFGNVDHDKDGKIIYEEAFFVFPDLARQRFAGYDANADGALNLDEYVVLYASETALAKEPKPGGEEKTPDADSGTTAQKSSPSPTERNAPDMAATRAPDAPDAPDAPPITNEDLISVSIIPSPEEASGKAAVPGTSQSDNPAQPTIKETAPAAPGGQPRTAKTQPQEYAVARGDILIKIAQKFNVTVEDILKANPGLNPDNIREGQKLLIPVN